MRIKAKNSRDEQNAVSTRRLMPAIPFPNTFYKEPQPVIDVDTKFRILSAGVLNAYSRIARRQRMNLNRSQWLGFKELRELTSNGIVRVSVSDKGGEFVVLSQDLDREITELHLSDATLYRRVSERDYHSQCKRLNHVWVEVGKAAGLDERFISRL